jgi:hypothetical protein
MQTMGEMFQNVILNIILHGSCKRNNGQTLRLLNHFTLFSRTVRIVMIVQDGRFGVQFLAESNYLCGLQNIQTGSGAQPASYSVSTEGHEADHHLHLMMKLQMRSYASFTHVCLHAMDRDNFTSLYFTLSVPQDLS